MSLSLRDISQQVNEKNKSIANIIEQDKTGETKEQQIFRNMDEAFSKPENQNRVDKFNEKMAKFGLFYNPSQSKDKSIAGCTSCTTITGIIVRLCENYGCIAKDFVTSITSDDCNQLLVESISLIQNDLDLLSTNDIDVSGTADDNSCIIVPMRTISVFSTIDKKAICSCSSLDKVILATERLAMKLSFAFDKAILYGRFNTATSTYVALPTFDSIDLLIPAVNKLTANSIVDLYNKIARVVAEIVDYTNCPAEDIKITMRAGVKIRMNSRLDLSERPVTSELLLAGSDCEMTKIACANALSCQSVNRTKDAVTGVITTDVFIGYQPHYVFGTFEFPAIEMMQDPLSQQRFRIGNMTAYAGKLLDPKSFYKITVTLPA